MKVYRPIILDKVKKILESYKYNFNGIDFDLYDTDFIEIYDKPEGKLLHKVNIKQALNIPLDILNKEYNIETLEKRSKPLEKSTYSVCFYLNRDKDKTEQPIDMKSRFI